MARCRAPPSRAPPASPPATRPPAAICFMCVRPMRPAILLAAPIPPATSDPPGTALMTTPLSFLTTPPTRCPMLPKSPISRLHDVEREPHLPGEHPPDRRIDRLSYFDIPPPLTVPAVECDEWTPHLRPATSPSATANAQSTASAYASHELILLGPQSIRSPWRGIVTLAL